MSERVRQICLINASLRGSKASSLKFLLDVGKYISEDPCHKTVITVRGGAKEHYRSETLSCLAGADAFIFGFPLYDYGLPGALMRLLEEYYAYVDTGHSYNHQARVYAVANCACPRPELTTGEAVRVIRNFCRRLNLDWRFAVAIGTGPVVILTRQVPFLDLKLKHAFREIAEDAFEHDVSTRHDMFIYRAIPEAVIRRIKEHCEKRGGMIRPRDVC